MWGGRGLLPKGTRGNQLYAPGATTSILSSQVIKSQALTSFKKSFRNPFRRRHDCGTRFCPSGPGMPSEVGEAYPPSVRPQRPINRFSSPGPVFQPLFQPPVTAFATTFEAPHSASCPPPPQAHLWVPKVPSCTMRAGCVHFTHPEYSSRRSCSWGESQERGEGCHATAGGVLHLLRWQWRLVGCHWECI